MIASCMLEKGKIEDALKILNDGLKITNRPKQEYFGIYFLMGNCFEAQGDNIKSLKAFMKAYNIDKTVPDLTKKITQLRDKVTAQLRKRGKKVVPAKPERAVKKEKVAPKKSRITYL
jgi:tetratricopeptide (TPR) repeat protein